MSKKICKEKGSSKERISDNVGYERVIRNQLNKKGGKVNEPRKS
ncbi:MAG: hypothetical protein ACE5K0_06060 [Candidatus Methanofastidiosia archaeon]